MQGGAAGCTGGSVYFLSRQGIVHGAETLTIEVRDPSSDMVLSRRPLRYGEDYEINYLHGVVLLKRPLASSLRHAPDDDQHVWHHRYADDVGDLTHDDGGVFVNVIGKF